MLRRRGGLAGWMRRVLVGCTRARRRLAPDEVHELRVALRRCRSIAAALEALDGDAAWRKLRRSARPLFRALGELRDAQVLGQWLWSLGGPRDPLYLLLRTRLARRERELKLAVRQALAEFDRGSWAIQARRLPPRAAHLALDGPEFVRLALARWAAAHQLHRRALAQPSPAAWHRLRIGLKRFRYVVDNFLPRRHAAWGADLKRLQDLLGEVHDLDLLRLELQRARRSVPPRVLAAWRARITAERRARITAYRRQMTGRSALWPVWLAELG